MRLLNIDSFELEEFLGDSPPPYPILSHTWGPEEVNMCCIDKSSSAELSEAVNSMYRWYSKAEVCYAYEFECSRWFTRCWTLQELIAPPLVTSFNTSWRISGTNSSLLNVMSLCNLIFMGIERTCTKQEDMAYSFMGLFDINMPVIYGEGENFCSSLQDIFRHSYDQSILA
ncbi:hypothetical protein F5B22DRAFT_633025 [Xylaria bambusicola]|uniref:uncharacterized protein n=1 Tax=Xylaria bambusicola TaxID=326684 RepID=UPI0020084625|nr:uncharacterized protein F5B22DRAFT_633025 [Xylaria bambusicola]KAI0526569.1 hypothetical protein F5B22DRAFT_633025 [Xylaria bambusicola]